jgi:hypothetical protein
MDQETVQKEEEKPVIETLDPASKTSLQASNEAEEQEKEEEEDILAEARKVRDENKKILEQLKAERQRIERATAEMMMTGRSRAIQSKQETADEKWEREAKIRYAGTGMDPTPIRK